MLTGDRLLQDWNRWILRCLALLCSIGGGEEFSLSEDDDEDSKEEVDGDGDGADRCDRLRLIVVFADPASQIDIWSLRDSIACCSCRFSS